MLELRRKEAEKSPNKKLNQSKCVLPFHLAPSESYKFPPYIATEQKIISSQSQFVPSLEVANYSKKESHFVGY